SVPAVRVGKSGNIRTDPQRRSENEADGDFRIELHCRCRTVVSEEAAAIIDGCEPRVQARSAFIMRRRLPTRTTRIVRGALVLPLLALATAGTGGAGEAGSAARVAADSASLLPRQTREFLFAGRRGGAPLGVALAFRTVDGETRRSREVRGWIGHGER